MRIVLVLALTLAACSSDVATSASVASADAERLAAEYAVSAERALGGTAFEPLGSDELAGIVVGLCLGFGVGAIPATIDGLDVAAPAGDVAILSEVLVVGVGQVCPERAPLDVIGIYLDAVAGAARDARAEAAFDEAAAVRAAPVVCESLESGAGVEAALLAAVWALFEIDAAGVDDLAGRLDGDQGLIAGAVLGSATALLCPKHVGEVEAFVVGL